MTCASVAWFKTQQDPLGTSWVSSAYKHRVGVKGASSMTALAHWFPPPSSSGCLLWPNGQDTGMQDWLSRSFISRLGDCSSGPQRLIYVCTWKWLIESKSMLKKRWLNAVRVLSVCHPCLSGDVRRCQRWPGRRLFHIALHGSVLIESGHGLSSGGYMHDVVLLDWTVAECDRKIPPEIGTTTEAHSGALHSCQLRV